MFLVRRGTPGFTAGQSLEKLGCRGSPTSALFFEGCGSVEIRNCYFAGSCGKSFVRIEGCSSYFIDRVEITAFAPLCIAPANASDKIFYRTMRSLIASCQQFILARVNILLR